MTKTTTAIPHLLVGTTGVKMGGIAAISDIVARTATRIAMAVAPARTGHTESAPTAVPSAKTWMMYLSGGRTKKPLIGILDSKMWIDEAMTI